jgi:hypothetical protein
MASQIVARLNTGEESRRPLKNAHAKSKRTQKKWPPLRAAINKTINVF